MMVQGQTNNNANTRDGILGFFAKMFSGSSSSSSRSSSSGYLQPMTAPEGDVILCQPVEGVACQSVTMVPGP